MNPNYIPIFGTAILLIQIYSFYLISPKIYKWNLYDSYYEFYTIPTFTNDCNLTKLDNYCLNNKFIYPYKAFVNNKNKKLCNINLICSNYQINKNTILNINNENINY